ncbi:hypothetical protein LOZ60_004005 [Ophidiomyces ophidiicola]|nr:hypothetical protein LOZ60_004005 [Ophidiomyces ophidiicola]KAI2138697.1 hypothetical protein LOZ27_005494 [Ophidiomyces ophidiicola]KAI2154584.1 hypothetical protein LOZ25_004848 [Ophidiomyces ophidiicola]KAI2393332.1 hypothetical protein LOY87_002634 [Ophidiomyces ophidiicola]
MQTPNIESCLFPRLKTQSEISHSAPVVYRSEFECHRSSSESTLFDYLMSAWSIVLARYTDTKTAQFGVIPESIAKKEATLEEWGALIDLDPTRSIQKTVALSKTREWHTNTSGYRGRFNTCIARGCQSSWIDEWLTTPGVPIDLVIQVETADTTRICLFAISTLLDKDFTPLLSSALQHVFLYMSESPNDLAKYFDITPDKHRRQIQDWNEPIRKEPIDECIHHMIYRQCAKQPNEEAICSWDGSLTYSALDHFSSNIMDILYYQGIVPETIIPLLFEKSKWTAVAMVGVLKAGAAFVLLDPTHPIERLQNICQNIRAKVILTSKKYAETSSSLADIVIQLPNFFAPSQPEGCLPVKFAVTSKNAAYVSFTSGSTGKPKGVVIEHASICTNALVSSDAQNLRASSRVLQFASYAFDVSIHETLVPLMLGGCVCIPSDVQRVNFLQEAIIELRVNWMELTPSVARLLKPEEIPAVKTLVVGGESISPAELVRWASSVWLAIAYGPAECTVVSTVQTQVPQDGDPFNIGRGYGGTTWVVEPEDHDRLVPIGAVGELVIGGPIVGREYLRLPQQTAAVFITNPPWSAGTFACNSSRFYKTGDLVRQQANGTLVYLGRKDTQVKLRGQRIELGEIEHHAEALFPGAAIAVEMGNLHHGAAALVLFVEWDPFKSNDCDKCRVSLCRPNQEFAISARNAKTKLESVFPRYMLPELLIPLCKMPLSPTAKVDRKALRAMIPELSKSDLQTYQFGGKPNNSQRAKTHDGQLNADLVQLVAHVLSLNPQEILGDDDFFHLGGDSVSAIMLATQSQRVPGLSLTVTDIFQNPTISQLSQHAQMERPLSSTTSICPSVLPFSMLELAELDEVKEIAVGQCGVFPCQIEDIYPTSPLQERFMARTARHAGAFQAQFTFRMPKTIDWDRLRRAWNTVVDSHSILRTRIINAGSVKSTYNTFQVVIRGQKMEWLDTELKDCQTDGNQQKNMSFGTALIYLVALRDASSPSLKLIMHHALFDWWSYNQILEAVQIAYEGRPIDQRHFSPFIKYIHDTNKSDARTFWKKKYIGLQTPPFLAYRSTSPSSRAVQWTRKEFHIRLYNQRGVTISAMIRLAWAMIVAQQTGALDVVFGVTVMGRSTQGAADITGPTIATYPLRITLQQDMNVSETLQLIQKDNVELIPFEQTGLHEIQKASAEAAMACEFQSLLVVQPLSENDAAMTRSSPTLWELEEASSWKRQSYTNFSTQVLNIICEPETDRLTVNAFFDDTILSLQQVELMLQSMESILGAILDTTNAKIGDMVFKNSELGNINAFKTSASLPKMEETACGYLGDGSQVRAEWIIPKGARVADLVLFVGVRDVNTTLENPLILKKVDKQTKSCLSKLLLRMQNTSPGTLVPRCCIPIRLQDEPLNSDELLTQLREAASKLTWASLRSWESEKASTCQDPSPIEIRLKRALAAALRLDPDDIDLDDNFVSLGCDSLIAMQFASKCNRDNMMVTVSDIFERKSIVSLASKVEMASKKWSKTSDHFSIVRSIYGDLQKFEQDMVGLSRLSKIAQVVDAFPCTSTHLGLLPRDPFLQAHTIWELSASDRIINPFQLAGAWRKVVDRHAALRTVLLESQSRPSQLFQVVLDSSSTDTEVVTGVEDIDILPMVRKPFLSRCGRNELPYKFTIYQTCKGRVFCKLEGRHAFLDAVSVLILLQELESFYQGNVSSPIEPLYQLWALYIEQWSEDPSHMQFWQGYLADIRPCIVAGRSQEDATNASCNSRIKELRTHSTTLMPTRELRRYCDRLGFSVTNVFQVAWARVLQKYTGLNDICFGTLVSGRDAPVHNVNDIVGSLFNVLVCRLLMPAHESHGDTLKKNELAIQARLSHQHCSLKDVTRACSGSDSPLFNTCLSVEQPLSSEGEVCFREVETHEETEYDLIAIVSVSSDIIKVQIVYWSTFIEDTEVSAVGDALKKSVESIISWEMVEAEG